MKQTFRTIGSDAEKFVNKMIDEGWTVKHFSCMPIGSTSVTHILFEREDDKVDGKMEEYIADLEIELERMKVIVAESEHVCKLLRIDAVHRQDFEAANYWRDKEWEAQKRE